MQIGEMISNSEVYNSVSINHMQIEEMVNNSEVYNSENIHKCKYFEVYQTEIEIRCLLKSDVY